MNNSPKYYDLRYVVEVRYPRNSHYETMAAFNHVDAALSYAALCRDNNRSDFTYRVLERGDDAWKLVS